MWDVATGEMLSRFLIEADKYGYHQYLTMYWSSDGMLIATDFENHLTKIWDSQTGEVLMSFSVPGAPLTIGWSPDGTHVIVTGDGFNEPVIKRI